MDTNLNRLTTGAFGAMTRPLQIEWIEVPAEIRERYQYFTEAPLDRR